MIKEKTDNYTIIQSQCGEITICNSTRNATSVLDRKFAQLQVAHLHDEAYVNLTDEAIDEVIDALQNAKTKK